MEKEKPEEDIIHLGEKIRPIYSKRGLDFFEIIGSRKVITSKDYYLDGTGKVSFIFVRLGQEEEQKGIRVSEEGHNINIITTRKEKIKHLEVTEDLYSFKIYIEYKKPLKPRFYLKCLLNIENLQFMSDGLVLDDKVNFGYWKNNKSTNKYFNNLYFDPNTLNKIEIQFEEDIFK